MHYKHPLDIPKSGLISGLRWTGEREEGATRGIHGDTYPMTWADDNEIYMSSGDPNWAYFDGVPRSVVWEESIKKSELYPQVGGLDIEKLKGSGSPFDIELINTMPGFMGPGGNGAKPSGMICVDGSLYLAAQNLLGRKNAANRKNCQHGSDATIIRSDDYGKTWIPDIEPILAKMESELYDRKAWKWLTPPEERKNYGDWAPMFHGSLFGGPSFVQFGKNNEGALDNYVYAISGDQWDNGSEMRLGRVNKKEILQREKWQWAETDESGNVHWNSDLESSKPVLTIEGHFSLPEMVYVSSINRYILLTWGLHRDFNTSEASELTILESENPWGPFKLVHYEEIWDSKDVCPYCPRIPLKWFNSDTFSGRMVYSGNWSSPEPWYKAHVRPFEFIMK